MNQTRKNRCNESCDMVLIYVENSSFMIFILILSMLCFAMHMNDFDFDFMHVENRIALQSEKKRNR